MRVEQQSIEFAGFRPAVPPGLETIDALLNHLRALGIEIWTQGGRVRYRPAVDDGTHAALERFQDLLVWACERRLNPSWWRPAPEIWFGDLSTAIEWEWRKKGLLR